MTAQEKIPEIGAVVESYRELARIVEIDDVVKHPKADRLSIAMIGGWQCVIKLNEFTKGQRAIYCEIDSLLPLSQLELFGFLEERKNDNKLVNGVSYHRLRSIKLRGELSQGLLVPIPRQYENKPTGFDLTAILGVLKYEAKAVDLNYNGVADPTWYQKMVARILGNIGNTLLPWPRALEKTEQDRIQNRTVVFNREKEKGTSFEVSVKLNGMSMTAYLIRQGDGLEMGLCSRNHRLDLSRDKWSFTDQCRYWVGSLLGRNRRILKTRHFVWPEWKTQSASDDYLDYWNSARLDQVLQYYYNVHDVCLTIQGELVGPGIESNFENLTERQFYVYSIFQDGNKEFPPAEAREIADELGLHYVPVIDPAFVIPKDASIKDILEMAEGKSALSQKPGGYREGLVFKSNEKNLSFKVISNSYLLKNE